MLLFLFFFNDTATTEIYTLSLHDALPIFPRPREPVPGREGAPARRSGARRGPARGAGPRRRGDRRRARRLAGARGSRGDRARPLLPARRGRRAPAARDGTRAARVGTALRRG